MKKTREMEAISVVAEHHNIGEDEIRVEMQHAIDTAMGNPNFTKIFGKDVRPSPEEFLRIISDTVKGGSEKAP